MITAKREVIRIIESLPEECSFEDIQYHLYVVEKVKRSKERLKSEGYVEHSVVREKIEDWLRN